MKRKFLIVEIQHGGYPIKTPVKEPQLKARIYAIIHLRVHNNGADWDWKKAIDILLNGEK